VGALDLDRTGFRRMVLLPSLGGTLSLWETGAVTGVAFGVVSSLFLVLTGRDVRSDPLLNLTQPGIISIQLGFVGCIAGTLLSRPEAKAESEFEELFVRSETGLGAERPVEGFGLAPRPRRRAPAAVTSTYLLR
jgi:hypothetical protein